MPNTTRYKIELRTSYVSFDPSRIIVVRPLTGNFYNQGGSGTEILYVGSVNKNTINYTEIP